MSQGDIAVLMHAVHVEREVCIQICQLVLQILTHENVRAALGTKPLPRALQVVVSNRHVLAPKRGS